MAFSFSTFTYGVLVGQLSVIIVMTMFIRFFIFADPPPDKRDYQSHVRRQRQAKLLPEPEATSSTILEKTYYDIDGHPPESLDWFTVLLAQAIDHLRDDARQHDKLLKQINDLLNSDKIPSFVDTINVTDFDIGQDYPIFSGCRILPSQPLADENELDPLQTPPQSPSISSNYSTFNTPRRNQRNPMQNSRNYQPDEKILEAQIDVNISDNITLGIDTRLLINFPRPMFAFLPLHLSVSIVHFSGTLRISLRSPPKKSKRSEMDTETASMPHNGGPTNSDGIANDGNDETEADNSKPPPDDQAYLTFSFLPNYQLELQVESLIGSRSKLKNVSKVAKLVESRLRKVFDERCVFPNEQKVYLPSLWPKAIPADLSSSHHAVNSTASNLPGVSNISHGNDGPSGSTNGGNLAGNGASNDVQLSGNGLPLSLQAIRELDSHYGTLSSPRGPQRLHPRSYSSASQLASNSALNLPLQPPISDLYSSDSSAIL